MGLILGILVLIVTGGVVLLIQFANGMASAPTSRTLISSWPAIVIGIGISAVLIASHFIGW